MSKQTDKSLFIVSSLPGLYQALLSGIESYKDLGNRIIRKIKTAQAFRQAETVRELAKILINIPIKEYQLIGQYYLILVKSLGLKYPINDLEVIIEQSQTYKTKALLLRGAFEWFQGKIEPALCFYTESLKTVTSISDYLDASRCVATAKAIEGFHNSALKDLERLLPLLHYAEPFVYYDILNSLAVELGETGRKYEARNIIKHVIASPLASAYPEWQDTANELKKYNRAFISIPQSVRLIERKHAEIESKPLPEPEQERESADVLPFTKPKEAPPPPKPDRIPQDILDYMTVSQKSELVMSLVQSKTLSSYGYNKMLASVGMVKRGASAKEIELDDLAFMADLISDWCNLIDPRLFIGVISALRDCDDRVRRTNIMDNMISEAIRQTDDSIESEEESRRKYERRLPKNDT
jgi:hypothetical protein